MRMSSPELWVALDAPEDLFAADRPDDIECEPELGYGVEELQMTFEVRTGMCNYLTAAQPSLIGLAPGGTVSIRLFHYPLEAPEPAEAHIGLGIDGRVLWEDTVPIPNDAGFVEGLIEIEHEFAAGAELQFHIHNHGPNDWLLFELEGTAPPP